MSVNRTVARARLDSARPPGAGEELLDLGHHLVGVADPRVGIPSLEPDESGVGEVFEEVAGTLDVQPTAVPPQEQRGCLDRADQISQVEVVEHPLVLIPGLRRTRKRREGFDQRDLLGVAVPGRETVSRRHLCPCAQVGDPPDLPERGLDRVVLALPREILGPTPARRPTPQDQAFEPVRVQSPPPSSR